MARTLHLHVARGLLVEAELEREHEEARREKEAAGAEENGSSDARSDAGSQRGSEVGFDGPVESQAACAASLAYPLPAHHQTSAE